MINETTAISFLLEIGRWAKNELSEIWKLKRKQQEADLTQQDQVERNLPVMIQEITGKSDGKEVQQTLALIERKRDAIYRARNAKLADGEELSRGEITQSMYEEREKKHNQAIRQLMDEIANDLSNLGFQVDRHSV